MGLGAFSAHRWDSGSKMPRKRPRGRLRGISFVGLGLRAWRAGVLCACRRNRQLCARRPVVRAPVRGAGGTPARPSWAHRPSLSVGLSSAPCPHVPPYPPCVGIAPGASPGKRGPPFAPRTSLRHQDGTGPRYVRQDQPRQPHPSTLRLAAWHQWRTGLVWCGSSSRGKLFGRSRKNGIAAHRAMGGPADPAV